MKKFYFYSILLLLSIVVGHGPSLAKGENNVGISNIQHTRSHKTISLTWDISSGNNQVDMFLWTPTTNVFTFIGKIDTFSKQTSFQIAENGNHVIKFLPSGGGYDVRYSFVVSGMNYNQKDITTVPKTGTKENIFMILGGTIMLYFLYSYRKKTKKKNNIQK